jgi:hypothetical protein
MLAAVDDVLMKDASGNLLQSCGLMNRSLLWMSIDMKHVLISSFLVMITSPFMEM